MTGQLTETLERICELGESIRSLCGGAFDDHDRELFADRARRIEQAVGYVLGKGFGAGELEQEIAVADHFVDVPRVILDVGANVGGWSRHALSRWPDAQVIAYEPQRANKAHFDTVEQEFRDRFHYELVAVSDVCGKSILYGDRDGSVLSSLYNRDISQYNISFHAIEEVPTVTLATEIRKRNIDIVDILKIDVEGHELAVLRGLGALIKRVRYIQIEFGGTNIDSRTFFKDFSKIFHDNNFTMYRIAPVGPIKITYYDESCEDFRIANYCAVNNAVVAPSPAFADKSDDAPAGANPSPLLVSARA